MYAVIADMRQNSSLLEKRGKQVKYRACLLSSQFVLKTTSATWIRGKQCDNSEDTNTEGAVCESETTKNV